MTKRVGQSLFAVIALLLLGALLWLSALHPTTSQADGVAFHKGDIFAGVGAGKIGHYQSDGTSLDTLDTTTGSNQQTGMCFDAQGNLYTTDFDTGVISKFDNQGNLVNSAFAQGFHQSPESCVFDGAGNMYVGEVYAPNEDPNHLRKFNSAGQEIANWTPARESKGIDWIDLAADQCTIFYTSEGYLIKRFNVCANNGQGQQMADFHAFDQSDNYGITYALRIRPNGDVLVAREYALFRLDADGNVIQRYDRPTPPRPDDFLFAMNLDPDGQHFWTAGFLSGYVYRYDIATGSENYVFRATPQISSMAGLALYGEIAVGAALGPTEPETRGGGSQFVDCPICQALHDMAVNTATGDFWKTWPGLQLPGRGPGLDFVPTYNSRATGTGATNTPGGTTPLGAGWTHSYNWWIDSDSSTYYMHEGNGAIVPFPITDTVPARIRATLAYASNRFTLVGKQGQIKYTFQGLDGSAQAGKLLGITDRNGYQTTLAYTTTGSLAGLLNTVTDAAGRSLQFAYTLTGTTPLLTSVTDPGGRTMRFGFDGNGDLQTMTDPGGQSTGLGYDGAHHLQQVTDPRQAALGATYDTDGRALSLTDPLQHTQQFHYTPIGSWDVQTVMTDALNYTTVYTYDSNRLTGLTRNPGAGQATWSYTYADSVYPVGVLTATDPLGHKASNTWDGNGNLLSSTDPLARTAHYTYNTTNDLLIQTNALQIPITYTYDISGNLLTASRPLTQTGQILTTTLSYDPAHPGDVLAVANPLSNSWTYSHDASTGYVLSASDPLADTSNFSYDALGRLFTVSSPRHYVTTFSYNAYGDPLVVTDTLGYRTTYVYDANRNLYTVTDANGRTLTYTYDQDNRPTRVLLPDGTHRDTGYDANGNVIAQTNELTQTTSYTYDPFNRLTSVADPLGHTTTYTYDLASNLTVMTDAKGLTTTFGYDPAYELTGIIYHDVGTTPNVSLGYNALGMRTVMTDGTGTSRYGYDSLNRLTSAQNGAGATVVYTYDLGSRLTGLSYPGIGSVTRGYDTANRLTSVTDWISGNGASQFSYDADGNLTGITYPGALVKAGFSYDAADQMSGLAYTQTKSSTVFLSQSYTRDPVGVLSTTTESGLGTDAYGYDGRYRLTSDALAGGTPSNRLWSYDGATEIIATSVTINGGTPVTTTRTYSADNSLRSLLQVQGGTTQKNLSLSYDANGNRTQQHDSVSSQTQTYGYDAANRLTTYGALWTYSYNGDGLRMSKAAMGGTTFTWDVGAGLPLLLSDGTAQYIYGPAGMLLEQVQGGKPYYYHADRLGSVRALTDNTGAVQNTYQYDAYGNTTSSTGSLSNPFRYTGQYQDSESGLYYLRARYYDPATQQFLTRDPITAFTGQPYAYVGGSPVNGVDPSGLAFCADAGMDCGESGGGVSGGGGDTFGGSGGGSGAAASDDVALTSSQSQETEVAESAASEGGTDFGASPPATAGTGKCPLTAGEAGRFGDLDSINRRVTGDDLTPHHMPQAKQGFTSRDDGGALMLPTNEHILTRTYGPKGRVTYRLENGMGFRSVLARDMFDILKLFGGKYNPGLRDLLDYYRTNYPSLINK